MVTGVDANASYFTNWDSKIMRCRTYGHDWPIPEPGKRVPKGFHADMNAHDGSYQITQECRRCGTERIRTTLPGGYYYDTSAHYTYVYPKNFVHISGEDDIHRVDIVNEYWRRVMELGNT